MKVYIDSDFKCHTTNHDGVYREVETNFFDGKCDTLIEGYRFKPDGETWTRSDGTVFNGGEMITRWNPSVELDDTQREYERQLIVTYEKALRTMGVVV